MVTKITKKGTKGRPKAKTVKKTSTDTQLKKVEAAHKQLSNKLKAALTQITKLKADLKKAEAAGVKKGLAEAKKKATAKKKTLATAATKFKKTAGKKKTTVTKKTVTKKVTAKKPVAKKKPAVKKPVAKKKPAAKKKVKAPISSAT